MALRRFVVTIVLGLLAGYVLIVAVLDNRLPNNVIRLRTYVDWGHRKDRPEVSRALGQAIWEVAHARPDIMVVCVDVLVTKDDFLDKFGNPLAWDVLLLEAVATNLEQVREYPSADAYVDDNDGPGRWQERPCVGMGYA